MQVDIGILGMSGRLSVDDDVLRIDSHGVREEIPYEEILSVKAHLFLKKVTIETADRRRVLTFFSAWPNLHRSVAKAIRQNMQSRGTGSSPGENR